VEGAPAEQDSIWSPARSLPGTDHRQSRSRQPPLNRSQVSNPDGPGRERRTTVESLGDAAAERVGRGLLGVYDVDQLQVIATQGNDHVGRPGSRVAATRQGCQPVTAAHLARTRLQVGDREQHVVDRDTHFGGLQK